jgi:hypothetical protein
VTARLARAASVLPLALLCAACVYQFRGGNFPEHIRTLAVDPVENETARLEVTGELNEQLVRILPPALGVRAASSDEADAVVRVSILRYEVNSPNYRPGVGGQRAEVLQRQVSITAQVQIVDQVNNEIYWEDPALRADGQFLETTESEEVGRAEAIRTLVQSVVDGAQSNW